MNIRRIGRSKTVQSLRAPLAALTLAVIITFASVGAVLAVAFQLSFVDGIWSNPRTTLNGSTTPTCYWFGYGDPTNLTDNSGSTAGVNVSGDRGEADQDTPTTDRNEVRYGDPRQYVVS